jgi:hypothetical protein
MNEEELAELRGYKWMPSRIPTIDALSTFVPEGQEDSDSAVAGMRARVGFSRWYPVAGGHKVLFPYEGGGHDEERFTVEPNGRDHEHCTVCGANIAPMTECWVTQSGRYRVLCEPCHSALVGPTQ